MAERAYDLSACAVGVVEADAMLSAATVRAGDVVIALGSSGLHSNGFSMVRHVLLGMNRMRLDSPVEDIDGCPVLGELLLTPTRIYARDCLALLAETRVRVFSHITGGGLAGNLARVLPGDADAVIDRGTWAPQPVFELIARRGGTEQAEMERTFNLGVGMVAVLAPDDIDRALALLTARHVPAWVCGEVLAGSGEVRVVGKHGQAAPGR